MRRITGWGLVAGVLAAGGCETVEVVVDGYRDMTPHEAYVQGLHDSGLAGTALSQDWIHEAAAALESPQLLEAPFIEEGYFTPEDPMAVGYRFTLERGQTATISLAWDSDLGGRVFFDLLRVPEDPDDPLRPVRADTTDLGFVYEPARGGEFVVRVQPELLRGGSYRLDVDLDAALAYPVTNVGIRAAQSLWGAPRDGGRRIHEGIDIFAPRGTPLIASVAGRVTRANETPRGGKVVWIRDERQNRSLYYAHLEDHAVSAGDRVQVGDTIGYVGNSGNAITTPPHLHFGIYYRGQGAVDPLPFVRPVTRRATELAVDRAAWGEWVRVRDGGINLRRGPSRRADVTTELEQYAPVRVLGGSGDWYRVALPDGSSGYVAARLTEPIDGAVGELVAAVPTPVVASPAASAPRMASLEAGASTPVLGRYGGFALVRSGPGFGWVAQEAAEETDG